MESGGQAGGAIGGVAARVEDLRRANLAVRRLPEAADLARPKRGIE
jgi:hypothetical protein